MTRSNLLSQPPSTPRHPFCSVRLLALGAALTIPGISPTLIFRVHHQRLFLFFYKHDRAKTMPRRSRRTRRIFFPSGDLVRPRSLHPARLQLQLECLLPKSSDGKADSRPGSPYLRSSHDWRCLACACYSHFNICGFAAAA